MEGRRRRRTGSRRARLVAMALVLVAVGGCGVVEQMTWDEYPDDPVLVPIAEKEVLGWSLPSTVSAGRAQAGALENFEEIAAVTGPQIEAAVGRPVEVTGVLVMYPGGAAQVTFQTVGAEPVVAFDTVVGLEPDGSIHPRAGIAKIEGFERATVNELYRMAYREKFAQMQDYLLRTYPQFTALPSGYLRAWGYSEASPILGTAFDSGYGDQALADRDAEAAVFHAYRLDPDRTDAEWRAVFEEKAGDRLVEIGAQLVLADPQEELTWEATEQIVTDMRDNPLFAQFSSWAVFTHSNLVLRDRDRFHEEWSIAIERGDVDESDWSIHHNIDGATA